MKVIVINECNHEDIGIALNYYHAVSWLYNEGWLQDSTEIWDDDKFDFQTIKERFGEDWVDMMTCEWNIDKFNEFFDGSFLLRSVEVIGTEEG